MSGRRKRAAVLLAATVGLAAGVTACGSSDDTATGGTAASGGSTEPYVIGYDAGITGGTAAIAQGELAGIKAYINLANAAGGIDGRKLELAQLDSKGVPAQAVSNMTQLATQKHASVAFGDVSANSCQASVPIAVRNKLPLICGTVAPSLLQPPQADVYTKYGAEATEAKAMENVISEQLKIAKPKVAIVALDTTSTKALFDKVSADVKAQGGTVVYDDRLPVPPSLDMSVQAQKIKASGANVVVEEIIPQQLQSLQTNLRNLKSDVPIVAEATTFSYVGLKGMKDDQVYELALAPIVDASSTEPAVKDYVEQLGKLGIKGQDAINGQSIAISYAAMADVVEALKKCGSGCTPDQVDQNLESVAVNLPGVNTDYSYTSDRHYPQTSFFLYRWDPAKNDIATVSSDVPSNPLTEG